MDSRRVGQVAALKISFRVAKHVNLEHFMILSSIFLHFQHIFHYIFQGYPDFVAKDLCQKTCDEQCWRPKLGLQGDVEASLH